MSREDYQREYQRKYKNQAKRVKLTFSMDEISPLEATAHSSDVPLAQFIKKLALQAFDNRTVPSLPEEVEERLADLDRLIRNIANNVNQMAHLSNRIERVLDEQEVFLHLSSLEKELRSSIEGMLELAGEH